MRQARLSANSILLVSIIFSLLLIFSSSCAKEQGSALVGEGIDFASFDESKKLQAGIVSPDRTAYFYAYKISGFKNIGNTIHPEIEIEIPEIAYQKTFLGQAIETPSDSLDALALPLGVLGSGTFNVKVYVRDKYTDTEKIIQKTLTI